MILANQTITTLGTFGVFPAIASFGTGYAHLPDWEQSPSNYWLTQPQRLDTILDDFVLLPMDKNLFKVRQINAAWQREDAAEFWFRNDSLRLADG